MEPAGLQPRGDQSRQRGIGSGNGDDRQAGSNRGAHQFQSWVGKGGHAGIGDHSHTAALLQQGHQFLGAGLFIVFVIADRGGINVEVVEQLLRLAGVFAGNAIDAPEHTQRPQGNVFKIADRGGYEVKPRFEGLVRAGQAYSWL